MRKHARIAALGAFLAMPVTATCTATPELVSGVAESRVGDNPEDERVLALVIDGRGPGR